jgi:hypothetical protein
MNERIEKLYQQSFMEVFDENSFPCMTFSKQRFAELIISDCLDIVDKNVSGMVGVNTMQEIEDHFGVRIE